MTEQERQLVQTIAREVLAMLRAPGSAPGGAAAGGSGEPPRADIRPPIGVCTGDYSKFPELAGRLYGVAPGAPPAAPVSPDPAAPPPAAAPRPEPVPLTGIITADQLQSAMDAAPDGVATLAHDARLTPLATDLARQFPQRVRRVGAPAAGTSGRASDGGRSVDPAALPWLWWIDGHCPAVDQVTQAHRQRLRPSGASRSPSSLPQVVRDLAAALRNRQVAGGFLFVHNAARAMCFANRCASIRAVVGTCGEAVEQGIAEIGANVLVIEYPHHGLRAIAAMVERMLQQPPRPSPMVERELADLHRCG